VAQRQAQSAIIPSFDAFLGIEHEMDSMREYLVEMRRYMPAPHQAVVQRLEGLSPPVRELVRADAALAEAYDACVKALARFRARHLGYADRYIRQPALSGKEKGGDECQGDEGADVGTGGTNFVVYLRKHHDETRRHMLGGDDTKCV
jgi:indoleamine 2,3-dioxygenase